MHADLIEAYLQTAYCVYLDEGREECLKIGEKSPWLDHLLHSAGQHFSVFITAENPGSKALEEDVNRQRTSALRDLLADSGYHFLEGYGVGQTSDWPPEQSFLVFGMNREKGLDLARKLGQNAFVFTEQGQPAELVFAQL
jgi:hypothetical protein